MLKLDEGQAAQGQAWWLLLQGGSRKSLAVARSRQPLRLSTPLCPGGGAHTQPIKFGAQRESSAAV